MGSGQALGDVYKTQSIMSCQGSGCKLMSTVGVILSGVINTSIGQDSEVTGHN